jgi:aspartate/glutamate racemase
VQLEDTLDRACVLLYVPLSTQLSNADRVGVDTFSVSPFRLPFQGGGHTELSSTSTLLLSSESLSEQEVFNDISSVIDPVISSTMQEDDSNYELTLAIRNNNEHIIRSSSDRASVGEHLTALLQVDPGIKHTAQVVSVCEQVSGEREAQKRLESLLADALLGGDLLLMHSNTANGNISDMEGLSGMNLVTALSNNIYSKNTKRGLSDVYVSQDAIVSGVNVYGDNMSEVMMEEVIPKSSNLKDVQDYLKRCRQERQEFDKVILKST